MYMLQLIPGFVLWLLTSFSTAVSAVRFHLDAAFIGKNYVDEMVSEVSAAPLEVLSFVSLMDDLSIGTPSVSPSELAVMA